MREPRSGDFVRDLETGEISEVVANLRKSALVWVEYWDGEQSTLPVSEVELVS